MKTISTWPFKSGKVLKNQARAADKSLRELGTFFSTHYPRHCHSKMLQKMLGRCTAGTVGGWLKANCLLPIGFWEKGVASQQYQLSEDGFKKCASIVAELLGEPAAELTVIIPDEFTYSEPTEGERLYNPLQNIKSTIRAQIFANAGFIHNYDLDSAAHVVMLCEVKKLGGNMAKMAALDDYIKNKAAIRAQIATDCQIDESVAKRIFSSILNGARLATNKMCFLARGLKLSASQRHLIVSHPLIQGFRDSASYGRAIIKRKHGVKFINFYFQMERKLLDIARDYVKQKGGKLFCEHDGFRTNIPINEAELEACIETALGVHVSYKHETITASGFLCASTYKCYQSHSMDEELLSAILRPRKLTHWHTPRIRCLAAA